MLGRLDFAGERLLFLNDKYIKFTTKIVPGSIRSFPAISLYYNSVSSDISIRFNQRGDIMTKTAKLFHITKKGEPAVCNASSPENCPLGSHFSSLQAAQIYSDTIK